jgi:hypothetical protein
MSKIIMKFICGLILIISLTGCYKVILRPTGGAALCNIETMTIPGYLPGETYHRTFEYDEFGNPVSVKVVENEDGTGFATFSFNYDNRHQLTGYVGYSEHRFIYNGRGQIIIDSNRRNYTGGDSRYEDRLYYDFFGRITKVVSKFYYDYYDAEEVGTVVTGNFEYDERGNLIKPGVVYDDKVSIYRTNPIWMLIHRNYSMNNEITATAYNAQGLPLSYDTWDAQFLGMPIITVDYKCEEEPIKYFKSGFTQ